MLPTSLPSCLSIKRGRDSRSKGRLSPAPSGVPWVAADLTPFDGGPGLLSYTVYMSTTITIRADETLREALDKEGRDQWEDRLRAGSRDSRRSPGREAAPGSSRSPEGQVSPSSKGVGALEKSPSSAQLAVVKTWLIDTGPLVAFLDAGGSGARNRRNVPRGLQRSARDHERRDHRGDARCVGKQGRSSPVGGVRSTESSRGVRPLSPPGASGRRTADAKVRRSPDGFRRRDAGAACRGTRCP